MLSLPQGIYILFGSVLGAVLGAIISGTLLLINTSINNKFQLERENQQRIWQEKSERQKWFREKIYENYRKTIQILTHIIHLQLEIEPENKVNKTQNFFNLYYEFSSEFYMIIVGHPDINSEKINEQIIKVLDKVEKDPTAARLVMMEIMQQDPRIKNVNEGYLNSEKFSTQSSYI